MEIKKTGTYQVTKWTLKSTLDYGHLSGADVKRMLAGYSYSDEMGLWFSKRGTIGYEVEEVKD